MRPRRVCVILWIVTGILALLCMVVPATGFRIGSISLRWPTLSEVLEIPQDSTFGLPPAAEDSTAVPSAADTAAETADTLPAALPPVAEPVPCDTAVTTPDEKQEETPEEKQDEKQDEKPQPAPLPRTDTRNCLQSFYEALATADTRQVRIVHYGDSQIEEDRMTMVLRERLQQAYGGGGVGLIPLHQTIPTRTLKQTVTMNGHVQSVQGGPKRYLAYAPKSMQRPSGRYGVMGQVAVMNDSAVSGSEDICLTVEPFSASLHPCNYFNRVRLLTDRVEAQVRPADSPTFTLFNAQSVASLPDSTTRCEIRLQGKGEVYGLSLETGTGVIVDNIPMRGCSGNIFTRIREEDLRQFFAETGTCLIILQFGGNMIPHTQERSTLKGYVRTLRRQIQYLRQCAPEASVLFIGPGDMSTRINGTLQTYPLLPYLDDELARMAEEEQIGYWSLYQAMGGRNSMPLWKKKGWAGNDYVHFTRKGAAHAGEMLWQYLMAPLQTDTATVR